MNRSDAETQLLFVLSPGHIPALCFAELQQAINSSDPPDREWILDIMQRYNTELVCAPLEQTV